MPGDIAVIRTVPFWAVAHKFDNRGEIFGRQSKMVAVKHDNQFYNLSLKESE